MNSSHLKNHRRGPTVFLLKKKVNSHLRFFKTWTIAWTFHIIMCCIVPSGCIHTCDCRNYYDCDVQNNSYKLFMPKKSQVWNDPYLSAHLSFRLHVFTECAEFTDKIFVIAVKSSNMSSNHLLCKKYFQWSGAWPHAGASLLKVYGKFNSNSNGLDHY